MYNYVRVEQTKSVLKYNYEFVTRHNKKPSEMLSKESDYACAILKRRMGKGF